MLEPLRDPAYFARVVVDPDAGAVTRPGGLDLAPEPLCEEARRNAVQVEVGVALATAPPDPSAVAG